MSPGRALPPGAGRDPHVDVWLHRAEGAVAALSLLLTAALLAVVLFGWWSPWLP